MSKHIPAALKALATAVVRLNVWWICRTVPDADRVQCSIDVEHRVHRGEREISAGCGR